MGSYISNELLLSQSSQVPLESMSLYIVACHLPRAPSYALLTTDPCRKLTRVGRDNIYGVPITKFASDPTVTASMLVAAGEYIYFIQIQYIDS